jgi:hypothetical protein
MPYILRHKRVFIRWILAVIIGFVCIGIGNSSSNIVFIVGLFLWLKWPNVSLYIEQAFFRFVQCRSCQTYLDLIDYWKCSCNYIGELPRHVFSPCRSCGKTFSYLICPRCGVAIDV